MLSLSYLTTKKCNEDLIIGADCLAYMNANKHHFTGSVSKAFFTKVRSYFVKVCKYIQLKFPLDDPVLKAFEIADLKLQKSAKVSSLTNLLHKFPSMMPNDASLDDVILEYSLYQVEEIPVEILSEERIDSQWVKVANIKNENEAVKFKHLPKIMLRILTVPHSNAESERLFSMVRKNRTDFRASMEMKLAESLMIVKGANENCFDTNYSSKDMRRMKSAYSKSIHDNID